MGDRNQLGDRLIRFSQEHRLIISKTLFSLSAGRLNTKKFPSDAPVNTIKNQIDYILINNRFCSSVKKVATYAGADVPSDHSILLAKLRIRLSVFKNNKPKTKLNLEILRDENVKCLFENKINQRINKIPLENAESI